MMTKGFEKYFPLPWEVKIIDTATFIQSEFEPGEHTIKFNADNIAHVDALEYMVKCANLMPETVVLFGIVEEVLTLCATRTFDAETKHLLSHTAEAVQTFKKKLEGGADDEAR